MQNVALKA